MDEVPHIDHQVVFIVASLAIQEKTADRKVSGMPRYATVRSNDDRRGQFAASDGVVKHGDHIIEERQLVLRNSVQPEDEGVLLAGVVAGRQIDVHVALAAERL